MSRGGWPSQRQSRACWLQASLAGLRGGWCGERLMAGARSPRGAGEVNVLPVTRAQQHTRIHSCVPPVVCWAPVALGWLQEEVPLWLSWGRWEGSAPLGGRTCWLEQMCGRGWAGVCFSWSLPCLGAAGPLWRHGPPCRSSRCRRRSPGVLGVAWPVARWLRAARRAPSWPRKDGALAGPVGYSGSFLDGSLQSGAGRGGVPPAGAGKFLLRIL